MLVDVINMKPTESEKHNKFVYVYKTLYNNFIAIYLQPMSWLNVIFVTPALNYFF